MCVCVCACICASGVRVKGTGLTQGREGKCVGEGRGGGEAGSLRIEIKNSIVY